jgi:hypothetical protein
VSPGILLYNEVLHNTDNPGSKQATTRAGLFIGGKHRIYMPVVIAIPGLGPPIPAP